jgi:hypothetical protein
MAVGVKAVYNRLQLSADEMRAVSYSVDAGHMPIACTITLWDIVKGEGRHSFFILLLFEYFYSALSSCKL